MPTIKITWNNGDIQTIKCFEKDLPGLRKTFESGLTGSHLESGNPKNQFISLSHAREVEIEE